MKNKKKRWKILLLIGLLPFVIGIIMGIYFAFEGAGFIHETYYGLEAFVTWIVMYAIYYCPIHIVGIILTIVSIFKLKAKK